MQSMPKNLYCVRHHYSYFGFKGHSSKHVRSLVFGFTKEPDVFLVHDLIKRSKRYPSMTVDAKKRIVIHRLPARGLIMDLDVNDLAIEEVDCEKLIINNAVNGVDTCVVSSIENIQHFIVLDNYFITKIHETPKELYQKNLNALFKQ